MPDPDTAGEWWTTAHPLLKAMVCVHPNSHCLYVYLVHVLGSQNTSLLHVLESARLIPWLVDPVYVLVDLSVFRDEDEDVGEMSRT